MELGTRESKTPPIVPRPSSVPHFLTAWLYSFWIGLCLFFAALLRSHSQCFYDLIGTMCCSRESLRKPPKLCQVIEPVHYTWHWGLGSLLSDRHSLGRGSRGPELVQGRVRAPVSCTTRLSNTHGTAERRILYEFHRGTGRRSPLTKCSPRAEFRSPPPSAGRARGTRSAGRRRNRRVRGAVGETRVRRSRRVRRGSSPTGPDFVDRRPSWSDLAFGLLAGGRP